MATEREVLISVLKLTKEGPAEIKDLSNESQIPRQLVHETLTSLRLGIIEADGHSISAGPEQRLRAALKAVELGAAIERVCGFLNWSEFEDISVMAFEANAFKVKKHFRFSGSGRRWEIDILSIDRSWRAQTANSGIVAGEDRQAGKQRNSRLKGQESWLKQRPLCWRSLP